MKKTHIILLILLSIVGISQNIFGQAKKPTLMVLPSDNWCIQRFFFEEIDNQGTKMKVPNYKQAFQEDAEIGQVITRIRSFFNSEFPLKDAEQEIKNIEARNAEDNMVKDKISGSYIAESQYDKLRKKAKADIIIQLWWKITPSNNGNIVSFTIEAFDAYTSKSIASVSGNGKPNNSDILPVLLEKTIATYIKPFKAQIQSHFDELQLKGREILITIKRWNNWDKTLEYKLNGKELIDHINYWMHMNTFHDSYSMSDASADEIRFEQVRIPLFNERKQAIDAREFTIKLKDYLLQAPFNLDVKLMTRGLGEAILIIGEK